MRHFTALCGNFAAAFLVQHMWCTSCNVSVGSAEHGSKAFMRMIQKSPLKMYTCKSYPTREEGSRHENHVSHEK